MKYAFDLLHPAHFHLFKNLIAHLKADPGNEVYIFIRPKDVLVDLLKEKGWKYTVSSAKTSDNKFIGLFKHLKDYCRFVGKKKIDFHIGSSVVIGTASRILGGKSTVWGEDDTSIMPLWKLANLPTHVYMKPSCLSFEKGKHDLYHPSYHELAYLHPGNFTPDRKVIEKYGLREKEYVVARFSALKAFHDTNARGISPELWSKIERLIGGFQVVKSMELATSHQIAPWDMHHVLAFAKMIISDSQTMTIEGTVLGIPSVRINTFIGKSTLIEELEQKYKLAFGILPDNEELILSTIEDIVKNPDTEKVWAARCAALFADKIDLNRWMIEYYEK